MLIQLVATRRILHLIHFASTKWVLLLQEIILVNGANVDYFGIDGSWGRKRSNARMHANDEFKGIKDKVVFTKFNRENSTNHGLEEWINKMYLYFELTPQIERAKIFFASLNLEGYAHTTCLWNLATNDHDVPSWAFMGCIQR